MVIIRGSEPKQIDEDEVAKVIGCWARKSGVVVRQGFINGVDIVDIRLDEKRIKAYTDEVWKIEQSNQHDKDYDGGCMQRKMPVFRSLADVFEGMNIQQYLPKKGDGNIGLESGKLLE